MNINKIILVVFVCILTNPYSTYTIEQNNNIDVEKLKKSIVNIDFEIAKALYGGTGRGTGTGFIADKKLGIIFTNSHIAAVTNIADYIIRFSDGSETSAKFLYNDLYTDFGILKVDPKTLPENSLEVELSNEIPKVGDSLFIIGNNENYGFSFHEGYLSKKYDLNGIIPQASYVINLNAAGGSSGSPVFNTKGKVVAINYGGSKTSSFALKNYYMKDALNHLKEGKQPKRNHIGVTFAMYNLEKAIKHRNFDRKLAKKYRDIFPDSKSSIIIVDKITAGSKASESLKNGDIIWQVNGKILGPDLVSLDEIMDNSKENSNISINVIREGKIVNCSIPVYSVEKNKATEAIEFAGTIFFKADDLYSFATNIPIGSISYSLTIQGSPFNNIASTIHGGYRTHIKKIDNIIISNLDQIIDLSESIINKRYSTINFIDYVPYRTFNDLLIHSNVEKTIDITLDKFENKAKKLFFNNKTLEWRQYDK
ncbi:MAG TPA: S1C family serine protease [Candidatus Megaira endosymbiont of Hartmannula sinica]|nr:S1C family serine protease [Candidatus Megaera endosymbiont of Hartmannula sinica]